MRLQALEGIRGLAAVFVVVYHLQALHSLYHYEWLRWSAPILDFFFVLSGFVMALGFSARIKDAPSFWSFWIRRAGRLWPMHLAMIPPLLVIPILRVSLGETGSDVSQAFSGHFRLDSLLVQLALLQIWFPEHVLTWNFPAWTMSAEIPVYVLMTFICLVSTRPLTRWLLAGAMLALGVPFFLQDLAAAPALHNAFSVSRAVVGFFVGFLLYDVVRRAPLRGVLLGNVLELAALAAFAGVLVVHLTGPLYLVNFAVCAFFIYVFSAERGLVSKVMSTPPLLWLGKVSLSVYLFHAVLWTWIFFVVRFVDAQIDLQLMREITLPGIAAHKVIDLPGRWSNNALLLGYITVILIAAHFLYRYIEVPSRDWFNAWARRVEGKVPATSKPSAEPAKSTA